MDPLEFYGDDAIKLPTHISHTQVLEALNALGIGPDQLGDSVSSVYIGHSEVEVVFNRNQDGKRTYLHSTRNTLKTSLTYSFRDSNGYAE